MANIPKYSAMKKVAYLKPEYSVMWPATISDSPSGTSKGVRLDSTRPEIKNKMNAAAPQGVVTNQCGRTPKEKPPWAAKNPTGESPPTIIPKGKGVKMSGNSYLTIWRIPRIA